MATLRLSFTLTIILSLCSCAKLGYLVEQGTGQVKLLTSAKKNEDVLNDVRISKKDKDKIRKIEAYKKYFYEYWQRDETSIYSKTTILHDPAVTYLVISSDFNKIEARKECFPIMGCFPYLGFFKKSSAKDYAEDLEKKGLVTYTRPVYAYSTLGYFTDTILSSFFYFDDFELAELIFHELFHTVFFVKDEVELNENLANYFGKQMAIEYFKDDLRLGKRIEEEKVFNQQMRQELVKLARELDQKLRNAKHTSKEMASKVVHEFRESKILPKVRSICKKHSVEEGKCYYLNRKWNQASLAAFMTYENKGDQLLALRNRISGDLKDFFNYIEEEFKRFEESNQDESFTKWLFGKSRSENEKAHIIN
ncbi:aminopeptidase [Halobacteriovorax marinus]|uniref:aminopeptidase n=1 Tax=Halobacteriovorax marinus TaxID=97084 RepID=UPI003A906829